MKRCLLVLSFLLGLSLSALADAAPTQEEVDVLVEREMFKFIHAEDWHAAVAYWKQRGATDEMLYNSFAKVARKTMNAPSRSEESRKCRQAVDSMVSFCPRPDGLTNILFVAEHAGNDELRGHAIWAWHAKVDTNQFLDWAERVAPDPNLGFRASAELMSCLGEEFKKVGNDRKKWSRLHRIVARHLEAGGKGALSADRVLLRNDTGYEQSALHRKTVLLLLDPERSPLKGNPFVDRRHVEGEYRRMNERLLGK